MKFAFLNPTVIALDDVPADVFDELEKIVKLAHTHNELNDEGNPAISIRGGQQIQIAPNDFGLDYNVLKDFVEKSVEEYLKAIQQQNPMVDLSQVAPELISAWTIKQGPGDYQVLHSHEANISGNIYIDVPKLDEASKVSDANIEFKLPVSKNIAHLIFTDSWRFMPEKAKMLVFPSNIPHCVYPWNGTGHRVSLAWDCRLVDRKVDTTKQ